MKRIRQHPLLTMTVLVLLTLLALVAFRLIGNAGKKDVRKDRVVTVGTMTPVRSDLEVRLAYTADVQPYQQVNIFSRVDGYISKIHVDRGDFVKPNQLLVEIDHTDYIHAVNRAKANLAVARADVARQEASIRISRLSLDRMRTLLQDQFVSQHDLDSAQATYDTALAQMESQRAQVRQMEVALQQAETNLTYSYIRAPFAGYVAVRNLDVGAYVTGSSASTSTLSRGILTLHDIDRVRVLLDVVEKDVPFVKIGQPAELRGDAYPGEIFEGELSRIVQGLDRNTRTMTVEVDIPNPDRLLKAGMFARVELRVGVHPNAIQVPIDAVTRLEMDQYLYTVHDGKARKVPVVLGVRDNGLVEITQGLSGNEVVIVQGKDLVTDGVAVKAAPVNVPSDPKPQPSKEGKS